MELERAILAQDPSLAADHDARAATGTCPWMGLVAYDDEHRDTFFGRREDVEACLRRLADSPLLVLVGPSGCGKSSLMKAGIVPALRARGHDVVVLTPGVDPLANLAAARAEAGSEAVLCVDQFEEAFAGATADVGSEFLGAVAECARTGLVVLTLRSDHVAGLVRDPGFAALAERGMHLVVPLTGDRLRATIEGPARVAGLRLEPGLVDLLLRDAADEPGALPLLSHALAETWRKREGTLLTVEGYRATGGISGAVAASADRLSASLSDEGRNQLRWLMLRMAGLADQGEPVRTPVDRSLATDGDERARVVDLLVRARLVTSAEGSIELAHEALVRAWPRLRSWLEEDREGQRVWRHLADLERGVGPARPAGQRALHRRTAGGGARVGRASRRPARAAGAGVPRPLGAACRGRAACAGSSGPGTSDARTGGFADSSPASPSRWSPRSSPRCWPSTRGVPPPTRETPHRLRARSPSTRRW